MAKTSAPRSKQAKAAASHDPPPSTQEPTASKTPRATPIPWDANKDWTWAGIKHLQQNPVFRLKLFSDSVSEAKRDGRKKVANGDGKAQLFHELAEVIFTADIVNTKTREDYQQDPKRYSKSTQQQFSRLKKKYSEYRARFKETGGGVKLGSDAANLEAEILDEWPFYADLHDLWSELPNYNPVGVSNAAPGQDLAGQAASLFEKPSKSKTPTQETEDEVPEVLEDDEDDRAGDPNTSEWTTEDDDVGDVGATVEDDDDEVESAVPKVTTAIPKPQAKSTNVKINAKPAKSTNGKSAKGKKRPFTSTLDYDDLEHIHAIELKEDAKRREERGKLRMKELELEQEKLKAKREKMAMEREKLAAENRRQEVQMELMMAMLARQTGSSGSAGVVSTPHGGSMASSSTYQLPPAFKEDELSDWQFSQSFGTNNSNFGSDN